jgi:hypothetical protein
MAGLLVALEELVLLGGGAGGHFGDGEVRVEFGDAFLGAVGDEFAGADADGDAGVAAGADGGVGDVVAAAEAAAGEAVVQGFGGDAGEFGDDFTFCPAGELQFCGFGREGQ